MTYRILSLDGGGLFGSFTASVLERIVEKHPDFLDKIDLIAGTSVGGIIALAIANGLSPSDCVEIFNKKSDIIFDKRWVRKLFAFLGVTSFYNNEGRKKVLEEVLGNVKLKDLKKKVVIPAFELNNDNKQWCAKLFHNFGNPIGGELKTPLLKNLNKTSRDISAVDVGLATSSAPVYFPSYGVYIDGGVVENNPTMAAIAQVLDPACLLGKEKPILDEICVLSIGNGLQTDYISENQVNWGWLGWVRKIFNIFVHADITTTDYQCKQLLGTRYCKIYPILPTKLSRSMDDTSLVPELVKFGNNIDLKYVDDWLQLNW